MEGYARSLQDAISLRMVPMRIYRVLAIIQIALHASNVVYVCRVHNQRTSVNNPNSSLGTLSFFVSPHTLS
jgi:hypothetical protein